MIYSSNSWIPPSPQSVNTGSKWQDPSPGQTICGPRILRAMARNKFVGGGVRREATMWLRWIGDPYAPRLSRSISEKPHVPRDQLAEHLRDLDLAFGVCASFEDASLMVDLETRELAQLALAHFSNVANVHTLAGYRRRFGGFLRAAPRRSSHWHCKAHRPSSHRSLRIGSATIRCAAGPPKRPPGLVGLEDAEVLRMFGSDWSPFRRADSRAAGPGASWFESVTPEGCNYSLTLPLIPLPQ